MPPIRSHQLFVNAYAILGIDESATPAEITKAYRHGALRTHPDKAGVESTSAFRAIEEAYRVLKDPATRKEHDNQAVEERLANEFEEALHRMQAMQAGEAAHAQAKASMQAHWRYLEDLRKEKVEQDDLEQAILREEWQKATRKKNLKLQGNA